MPKRKKRELSWQEAPDIRERIFKIIDSSGFSHIKESRVFCYRSYGAKTRAYARIWGLGRIWQQTLDLEPAYAIEVISEKFDKLTFQKQEMVLIHEVLHIPKTFSGALLPHRIRGGVNDKVVREIYNRAQKNKI